MDSLTWSLTQGAGLPWDAERGALPSQAGCGGGHKITAVWGWAAGPHGAAEFLHRHIEPLAHALLLGETIHQLLQTSSVGLHTHIHTRTHAYTHNYIISKGPGVLR